MIFCIARPGNHENDLIHLYLFLCDYFLMVFASSDCMVVHTSWESEGSYGEQVLLDTTMIQMII